MGVDTAAIQKSIETCSYDNIPSQVQSIRKAVTHIQHQTSSLEIPILAVSRVSVPEAPEKKPKKSVKPKCEIEKPIWVW